MTMERVLKVQTLIIVVMDKVWCRHDALWWKRKSADGNEMRRCSDYSSDTLEDSHQTSPVQLLLRLQLSE